MKTAIYPMLFACALALTACSNKSNPNAGAATSDTPAPAAPVATPPAAPADAMTAEAAPATTDAMAGMSAKEHAAMADQNGGARASDQSAPATGTGSVAMGVQAGWYTGGIFRACGSTQAMKVDKPAEIDAQIKKGGMSAGDPVYVRLEGMPMGNSYMLTRVAQVGSKTPVRDCPMTGTTTQSGG